MNSEFIQFFFDTETWMTQPGLIIPPIVCVQPLEAIYRPNGDRTWGLKEVSKNFDAVLERLWHPNCCFIGANVAYDFGVLVDYAYKKGVGPEVIQRVFEAYRRNCVRDVLIREKLIFIEEGRYKFDNINNIKPVFGMEQIVKYRFGRDLKEEKKGKDSWRFRYHELTDVPVADWPHEARRYAMEDTVWTRKIFEAQEFERPDGIADEYRQTYAAWALHLSSAWGMRTDPTLVETARVEIEHELEKARTIPKQAGLIRPNNKRNLKLIRDHVIWAYERAGKDVPVTDKGNVSTARETLEESNDDTLLALADYMRYEKLASSFLPVISAGTRVPINPRIDTLKVTGRTSYRKPNLQQLPRGDEKYAVSKLIRQCFIPRENWTFVSVDYDTLELRALAQVCLDILGFSTMAEAFKQGQDPHTALGGKLVGLDYGEAFKQRKAKVPQMLEARQFAKVGNFGFPGGLGAEAFVDYAKQMAGIIISLDQSEHLRSQWFSTWPEMKEYFSYLGDLRGMNTHGRLTIRQLRSDRVRSGCTFTQAANTYFQGLAADGAKEAIRNVAYECYCLPSSPLFDCRVVVFVHDEIIIEVPPWKDTHDAAYRLSKIMCDSMQLFIPSVPITASPAAMKRWHKGAEEAFDAKGRLIPWEPPEKS